MVQATRSLSPKRAAEMMQRFRSAVITVARLRARQVIKAQIKARGDKVCNFTAAQISLEADAYLAQHREELITKAAVDVASLPWRLLLRLALPSSHLVILGATQPRLMGD